MLPPFALLDDELAVGALLSAFRLRSFFLVSGVIGCLSNIVFDDLHLWVERGSFGQILGSRCDGLLFFSIDGCTYLVRIRHALQLFVLLHVLLDLLSE